MSSPNPFAFRGVYAATTTPFTDAGELDLDGFEQHCSWLADEGVAGIVPNGSLGEYEALTEDERAATVKAAIQAVGARIPVIPGVSGKTGVEARRWAEQAGAAGCPAVMCLPPTSHLPSHDETMAHFREVARAGLPIIAYNNPYSTRVDLTPSMLARLSEIDEVQAVKEFSQDARRVAAIRQAAPAMQILCGCDDTFVESMLMGAVGWIAGFVNALPRKSVELYEACAAERWRDAVEGYLAMLPLLRYDADSRVFVQAIKLAQSEAGRYGGPVRLPRLPLDDDTASVVRAATRALL